MATALLENYSALEQIVGMTLGPTAAAGGPIPSSGAIFGSYVPEGKSMKARTWMYSAGFVKKPWPG
jgi:hypothetical protein